MLIFILLVTFIYIALTTFCTFGYVEYLTIVLLRGLRICHKKHITDLTHAEFQNIIDNEKAWYKKEIKYHKKELEEIEVKEIIYDMNDALDYICKDTGLDKSTIKKILNSEQRYMESVGIVENPIMYEE